MDLIPFDPVLPLPASLLVLKAILVFSFVVHILFIDFMIGGTVLGVIYRFLRREDPFFERFAREVTHTVTPNKSLAVVLGVAPLLVISLAYTGYFYTANILVAPLWLSVIPLVILAFLVLYAYEYSWDRLAGRPGLHLALGLSGIGIFMVVPLIFLTVINLMLFPERWVAIRNPFHAVILANVIPRYLHFMNAALAVNGFFLFAWFGYKARREPAEGAFYHRAAGLGLLWGFLASLAQLVFGPLNYFTLQPHQDSVPVLILIAVTIVIAGTMLLLSLHNIRDRTRIPPAVIVSLLLIVLFLMATVRHVIRDNSLVRADLIRTEKTRYFRDQYARFMETYNPESAPRVTGESLFQDYCYACHAYDREVVGPTMQYVQEKYAGASQEIVNFILEPYKVDDAYPAMPKIAVSRQEAELLASYILGWNSESSLGGQAKAVQ